MEVIFVNRFKKHELRCFCCRSYSKSGEDKKKILPFARICSAISIPADSKTCSCFWLGRYFKLQMLSPRFLLLPNSRTASVFDCAGTFSWTCSVISIAAESKSSFPFFMAPELSAAYAIVKNLLGDFYCCWIQELLPFFIAPIFSAAYAIAKNLLGDLNLKLGDFHWCCQIQRPAAGLIDCAGPFCRYYYLQEFAWRLLLLPIPRPTCFRFWLRGSLLLLFLFPRICSAISIAADSKTCFWLRRSLLLILLFARTCSRFWLCRSLLLLFLFPRICLAIAIPADSKSCSCFWLRRCFLLLLPRPTPSLDCAHPFCSGVSQNAGRTAHSIVNASKCRKIIYYHCVSTTKAYWHIKGGPDFIEYYSK